jgi:hypothetical protein
MVMKKIHVLTECMVTKENHHVVDTVADTEAIAAVEMNMDMVAAEADVAQDVAMNMKAAAGAAAGMKKVAITIAAVTAIQILMAVMMMTMMIWIMAAVVAAAAMMIIIHQGEAAREDWVVNQPAN